MVRALRPLADNSFITIMFTTAVNGAAVVSICHTGKDGVQQMEHCGTSVTTIYEFVVFYVIVVNCFLPHFTEI